MKNPLNLFRRSTDSNPDIAIMEAQIKALQNELKEKNKAIATLGAMVVELSMSDL